MPVLSFIYNGGSRPGHTRYVYFNNKYTFPNDIVGYDFEEESVRRFNYDKCIGIVEMQCEKLHRTEPDEAIKQYKDEGWFAYYDTELEVVIIFHPEYSSPVTTPYSLKQHYGQLYLLSVKLANAAEYHDKAKFDETLLSIFKIQLEEANNHSLHFIH